MRHSLLALLTLSSSLMAAAQAPVIRAHLDPAGGSIVGQPVHLVVEVLVPNYFTGSPDFPEFELENAIVVLPEETPQNINDRIGGVAYAGIRRSYFLYPQQPGDYRLPPAQFTVPYANNPPKKTVAHLSLPALTFHADIPAEARGLSYFLPTTQLTLRQQWSSPLKAVHVGDTFYRTITVSIAKMQAMLIPPLPMDAPDGIRMYPEEPRVQDQKTDRGEFVMGSRTQSARYLIQKEGDYTLPAIELQWWSLTTHRLIKATLPAVHFKALPNPDYVAELPPEQEPAVIAEPLQVSPWNKYKFWIRVVAPSMFAFVFIAWLGWRYLPRWNSALKKQREVRRQSEAAYFRNLIRACKRKNASLSYQWLLRWLARAHPEATLDQFLTQNEDEELTEQVERLTAQLYATPHDKPWSGKEMARCLRKRGRSMSFRSLLTSRHRQLPALNP